MQSHQPICTLLYWSAAVQYSQYVGSDNDFRSFLALSSIWVTADARCAFRCVLSAILFTVFIQWVREFAKSSHDTLRNTQPKCASSKVPHPNVGFLIGQYQKEYLAKAVAYWSLQYARLGTRTASGLVSSGKDFPCFSFVDIAS